MTLSPHQIAVVVLAGGEGRRIGGGKPLRRLDRSFEERPYLTPALIARAAQNKAAGSSARDRGSRWRRYITNMKAEVSR